MYYLYGNVITEGKIYKNFYIQINDGFITYVGTEKRIKHYPVKEINSGFICPGFIDVHIHGVDGIDFMDKDSGKFHYISTHLPKYGVTSFLATSRTASSDEIKSFLKSAEQFLNEGCAEAHMIGVHLEGPWLNSIFRGAQNKDYIRKLTIEEIKHIIYPSLPLIKRCTLAPEELDDLSLLKYLISNGVNVSAGHTNASIEEIGEAIGFGLNQLTHTFNAMSSFDHKIPGTAAAAIYYENLICEIIPDGVHVHPKIVELIYRIKRKERLAFVSDCTGYNNLSDGEYVYRKKELLKKGKKVTLKNGTLAGSAITLNQGIQYVVNHCNIPVEEAIFMATETPISTIQGIWKRGKIKEGYLADIVILDERLNVEKTIIRGKEVYKRNW